MPLASKGSSSWLSYDLKSLPNSLQALTQTLPKIKGTLYGYRLGVPFKGTSKYGLYYFGVDTGVPLFWETTIW